MSDETQHVPVWDTNDKKLTPKELEESRKRFLFGIKAQEIAGNPLTPEEIAMFEMVDREGWSHERCLQYIHARVLEMIEKSKQ